jgi:probable F420-dependent oxidoreductase
MSVRVGLAIGGWPFAETTSPAPFWEFIDHAEALGFDSLWLTDRLVSRSIFLEPLSTLAAVAGRTAKMKFGMAVLVLPLRNPVVLAKELASIDFISNGRMLPAFGIGGDDVREYEATGGRKQERAARSDEMVELMRRLWTEENVTFRGRFYQTTDVTIAPRPLQRELPVWFGGRSEAAFRRTGRLGDGWLASFLTPAEFAHGVSAIKAAAAEADRELDEDHYGVIITTSVADSVEAAKAQLGPLTRLRPDADITEVSLLGTPDDCIAQMRRYLDAGCSKFVLRPAGPPETLLPQLDVIAREIAPAFDRTMAAV